MTDTDSLLFSCETKDIHEDMKAHIDLFDTSEYPKGHFLQCDLNKKVLGKMKDETKGKPITEFIGLRSKMYSFKCDDGKEVKRAKSVSKMTVKKELKHDSYKAVLFGETNMICSMSSLRSHKHEIFGEKIQKLGLSPFDDKRYLRDAVHSYAYGHYKVAAEPNDEKDNNLQKSDNVTVSILPVEQSSAEYQTLNEKMFTIKDFHITPCVKL